MIRQAILTFTSIVILSISGMGAESEKCPNCALESGAKGADLVSETPWIEPEKRKSAFTRNYGFKNQDNQSVASDDLKGKPLVITFLYTRCTNALKCPLAASTFAALEEKLTRLELLNKVRLIVVTYDPEYDSPMILKKYAKGKSISAEKDAMLLQPDESQKNALFDDLELPVNFSNGRVNIHGIKLLLLDSQSRIAKTYKTVIWENEKVVKDIQQLLAEAGSPQPKVSSGPNKD